MARRKTKRSEASNGDLSKEELNKLICYRYAQCGNATTVGKEFKVSRMYVTRAWDRLTEDERTAIKHTKEQVDEELNQKILDAERIAGDTFMRNVIAARELAGREILRRFNDIHIQDMSNKDFAALTRLLCNITTPEEQAPEEVEKQDTFRQRRESIRASIEKSLII